VITESEGIKAASNQKDYKTESEIENVLGKGEKFIRFSLICLTRTALSKLIFNCWYTTHNTSMFVLEIGYRLKYRDSV